MSALVGRKLRDHVRWTHARCQTLGVRCQTLEADFRRHWNSGLGEARFGAFRATFDPALKATVHTEPMSTRAKSMITVHVLDIEVPADAVKFEIAFDCGSC